MSRFSLLCISFYIKLLVIWQHRTRQYREVTRVHQKLIQRVEAMRKVSYHNACNQYEFPGVEVAYISGTSCVELQPYRRAYTSVIENTWYTIQTLKYGFKLCCIKWSSLIKNIWYSFDHNFYFNTLFSFDTTSVTCITQNESGDTQQGVTIFSVAVSSTPYTYIYKVDIFPRELQTKCNFDWIY